MIIKLIKGAELSFKELLALDLFQALETDSRFLVLILKELGNLSSEELMDHLNLSPSRFKKAMNACRNHGFIEFKGSLPESASKLTALFQIYSDAYYSRYEIFPISNARVFGQLKSLIAAIGFDSCKDLIPFYLKLDHRYYVQNAHPIGALLKDIQSIMTQYKTGKIITYQKVLELDKRQHSEQLWGESTSENLSALLGTFKTGEIK